ncbi:hypothetical protein Y032_0010g1189 [Ancylostoma ceylanicum]|uniref:Uncharacterized protein n=1 Tax=Ancylostoma ceylanicum TaxID=53326 RepID=A0A016VHM3_9BILA|nr:hypothetical protein Y032_0010g1189 [Ancylostoma ceylanicum]
MQKFVKEQPHYGSCYSRFRNRARIFPKITTSTPVHNWSNRVTIAAFYKSTQSKCTDALANHYVGDSRLSVALSSHVKLVPFPSEKAATYKFVRGGL